MDRIYKALVIDDEALARQDLIDVLAEFKQVDVVGEADSISGARRKITQLNPHIIFLDIQLPGESGFDLLEHLPQEIKIIFVTAFDQYAIRAFEVNAQDYLLKPVSRERLAATLERIEDDGASAVDNVRKLTPEDNIFLKKNKGYAFIRVSQIICVTAWDDYTEIFLKSGEHLLVHKSMKEWETRLPEQLFCRIHRSSIVNIEQINSIEPWYNQAYLVALNGIEKPLVMSRRYFSRIKNILG